MGEDVAHDSSVAPVGFARRVLGDDVAESIGPLRPGAARQAEHAAEQTSMGPADDGYGLAPADDIGDARTDLAGATLGARLG